MPAPLPCPGTRPAGCPPRATSTSSASWTSPTTRSSSTSANNREVPGVAGRWNGQDTYAVPRRRHPGENLMATIHVPAAGAVRDETDHPEVSISIRALLAGLSASAGAIHLVMVG